MFLIPIGHDQQTVRRLPWVTFVLLAVNLVVFLSTRSAGTEMESAGAQAAQQAVEYWLEHPHLDMPDRFLREVMTPRQVDDFRLLVEARKSQVPPAATLEERRSEQAQLDALVARYFKAKDEHPAFSFGLIPADVSFVALLTSMFMHAGWMHLLGNMFMLYLAGPPVEDAYGRPAFAALYVVSGVVAALAHVGAHPDSVVPLVGASGAIAGVMGAFLIRCSRTNIRFFYWWMLIRAGTFDAPAWLMLPLWLLQQVFMSMLPTGEGGVAYSAHVGGFAFGVLTALGLKLWKVEERFIHPRIEKELTLEQHPALGEGLAMLMQGDPAIAREKLAPALRDQPKNPDVHLAYWQTYVQERRAAAGVDHMARVIEDELRRKEYVLALDHWRELRAEVPAGGPAPLRWRLASELQAFNADAAREVLGSLATDPGAGLLGEKARMRLGGESGGAGSVAPFAPPAPTAPAPRTGALPVAPAAPPTAAVAVARATPALSTFEPPSLAVDWEPEASASSSAATARHVVVEECTIDRLDEGGLVIRGGDGAPDLLLYSQIEAVAVAGISAQPKPYLLVDLVLSPLSGGTRTVLRLASTHLDPRLLIGMPTLPPMQAFRELVERITVASGARLLPSPEALVKIVMFEGPEAYQRATLADYF